MPKLHSILEKIATGFGVYGFTFAGILLSQYAPLLLTQGKINSAFQWIRLGISALMAGYIVMQDESQGDPEGRKKNLKKRLAGAFKEGFLWNGMIGIAGTAAGQ